MRKNWLRMLFAPLFLFAVAGCDVDVEDPGTMPEVDVTPGEAPDVDVTGPDVEVGTETREVEVPDIDVTVPDENEQ